MSSVESNKKITMFMNEVDDSFRATSRKTKITRESCSRNDHNPRILQYKKRHKQNKYFHLHDNVNITNKY